MCACKQQSKSCISYLTIQNRKKKKKKNKKTSRNISHSEHTYNRKGRHVSKNRIVPLFSATHGHAAGIAEPCASVPTPRASCGALLLHAATACCARLQHEPSLPSGGVASKVEGPAARQGTPLCAASPRHAGGLGMCPYCTPPATASGYVEDKSNNTAFLMRSTGGC